MSRSRQPSINSQNYAIVDPSLFTGNNSSSSSSGGRGISVSDQSNSSNDQDQSDSSDSYSSYQESSVEGDETNNHEIAEDSMFDPVSYLHDSIMSAMDVSLEWNTLLAKQARTSGLLKSKYHEVTSLIDTTEEELIQYKADFERGLGVISDVMKDLNLISRKLESLEMEFKKEWPVEYQQGKEKVEGIMNLQRDISEMSKIGSKSGSKEENDQEGIYIV